MRRRLRIAVLALALLLALAGLVAGLVTARGSPNRDLELIVTNDGYAQPLSLRQGLFSAGYPFSVVAEPHRVTTLQAGNLMRGNQYTWSVVRADGKPAPEQEVHVTFTAQAGSASEGSAVQFQCTTPGEEWVVTLTEAVDVRAHSDVGDTEGEATGMQTAARELREAMVCKYVRREVRALSAADRAEFAAALNAVYQTSLAEGRETYGTYFTNAAATTLKHMGHQYVDSTASCSPFHGSSGFYTSHCAFVYELERAMQLVHPRVAMPYWDYSIDSSYLAGHWESTVAFSYFGVADRSTGQLSGGGPLSDIPVASAALADVTDTDSLAAFTNTFNRIAEPRNNNPSKYVQRFSHHGVCGLHGSVSLPGCSAIHTIFGTDNLADMVDTLEDSTHLLLHQAIGGATSCLVDLGSLSSQYPELQSVFRTVANTASRTWDTSDAQPPSTCSAENEDFEECRPVSGALRAALEASPDGRLSWSTAYALVPLFWDNLLQYMERPHSEHDYVFPGLSDASNRDLITRLTTFALSPPIQGHFTSVSASPEDPIFAPIHAASERLFTVARIMSTEGLTTPSGVPVKPFDFTFQDDNSCHGRSWTDPLPFSNFGDDTSDVLYTHEDLWNIFDPAAVTTPYIFDTLTPFCTTTQTSPSSVTKHLGKSTELFAAKRLHHVADADADSSTTNTDGDTASSDSASDPASEEGSGDPLDTEEEERGIPVIPSLTMGYAILFSVSSVFVLVFAVSSSYQNHQRALLL